MDEDRALSIRVGIHAARHFLATGSLANLYFRVRLWPSNRTIYNDRRASRAAIEYVRRHPKGVTHADPRREHRVAPEAVG